MKYFIVTLMLVSIVVIPTIAEELSEADLNKIRLLIHEELKSELAPIKIEITSIKADIVSLKEDVASLKSDIRGLDKRITDARNLGYALIALIGVIIGVPAWRNRKDNHEQEKTNKELLSRLETLTQKVEALENGHIHTP